MSRFPGSGAAILCTVVLLLPTLAHAQSPDQPPAAPAKLNLAAAQQTAPGPLGGARLMSNPKSPVAKGAVIGLLAGLGVGVVVCTVGECHGDEGDGAVASVLLMGGIGAGIGAAVGAILRPDAGHAPIYRSRGGTSIAMSPAISKRGGGLTGVIRW